MVRMRCTVWAVRPHLLAATHRLIAQGSPYVDEAGDPVRLEILEELKTIASRDLHADWQGRELHAILDAALGRRALQIEEGIARAEFLRRDRAALDEARRPGYLKRRHDGQARAGWTKGAKAQ